MARHYTEDEALAEIVALTRPLLVTFVRAQVIRPVHSETGPLYREVDLARLQLLCDLVEVYTLDDDSLQLVMSLIDQLHGVRGEMRALMQALSQEPAETRSRISGAIHEIVVLRD